MQPFQNIDSKERFIDVQTSDGIEKYSPRFLYVDSTGPRTTIDNIVDPKIRAFYQSDDVLGDFFDLIKKNRKTHCWDCKEKISTDADGSCSKCKTGIPCTNCGSCICEKPKKDKETLDEDDY